MKKFIGNVNGVEYTDRDAFNEAVKKAMENPCGTFVITSYEKNVPDEEIEMKKKNILRREDFIIELESDKTFSEDGTVSYKIPECLIEKLTNCDNKYEVKKHIEEIIGKWKISKKNSETRISDYENGIRIAEKNIEESKKHKAKIEGGIEYYKTLLSYLDENNEKKTDDDKSEKNEIGKDKSNEVKKIADINDILSSFSGYIKKKDFFNF